jgi:hypothetical protein
MSVIGKIDNGIPFFSYIQWNKTMENIVNFSLTDRNFQMGDN